MQRPNAGPFLADPRLFSHLIDFVDEFDSKPVEDSLLPETSGEGYPRASQNRRFAWRIECGAI